MHDDPAGAPDLRAEPEPGAEGDRPFVPGSPLVVARPARRGARGKAGALAQTLDPAALRERLIALSPRERAAAVARLAPEDADALLWDWSMWARPKQRAPGGDWRTWLIMSGRGFGKTRTGAEWVRSLIESGRYGRIALIGATAADVRDTMVDGESGILRIWPPWNRPAYQPTRRRLYWESTGAQATFYSAEEPDRLRGPQHDAGWADELASWRYPEAWDMFLFGLRLGPDPRAAVTTTPRPIPALRTLLLSPTTVVTSGSTYENLDNLADAFIEQIVARYEGTRLGRQELYAELLDDVPGALWTRERLEATRISAFTPDGAPFDRASLVRVVVAVDPEASSEEGAAETGIVVAGRGRDGHFYVLDDRSVRGTPHEWGTAAVAAYHAWGADRMVGEVNNGGEMVGHVVATVDRRVAFRPVRASRGKQARAEPVAALFEQGRGHLVGYFAALEDQLCSWAGLAGERSPDRLDALVWAGTELMLGGPTAQDILDHLRERQELRAAASKGAAEAPPEWWTDPDCY